MLSLPADAGIPVMIVVGVVVLIRYLPAGIVQILAVVTRDNDRRLACLEVLRLRRRDAATIPSYLKAHSGPNHVDDAGESPAGVELSPGLTTTRPRRRRRTPHRREQQRSRG
jgi:hypothetical protein